MTDVSAQDRHVAYAERYAAGRVNRFNAFAALERARLLLGEAKQIVEMFEIEGERDERADWWWNGLEIVPYTLVGLATCLEWHARSRLTDLYTYWPEAIDKQALDGKVPAKVLSQMIRAKVSIPQLLGVSFTVGTIDEYLGPFRKLFDMLGIETPPDKVIQPRVIEQIGLFGDIVREPLVRDVIEELFVTRHALVHEIGNARDVGRSARELWSPDRVTWLCHSVVSMMRLLETAITAHAPADFPNLLTQEGHPVDVRAQLRNSIEAAEARIRLQLAGRPDEAWRKWDAVLDFARSSISAHDGLFADRQLFESRDWAHADLLSRTMLEQRLALLAEVEAALERSGGARPS